MARQTFSGFTVRKATDTKPENLMLRGLVTSWAQAFPPVFVAALLLVGITVLAFVKPTFIPVCLTVFAVLLIIALFCRSLRKWMIPLLLVTVGTLSAFLAVQKIERLQSFDRQTALLEFTVMEESARNGDSRSVLVLAKDSASATRFKTQIWYQGTHLAVGKQYRALVRLYDVEDKENRSVYYGNGTFLSGNLRSEPVLIGENALLKTAGSIRSFVRKTLMTRYPSDQAATLNAVTVGDRSRLTVAFESAVRTAGVSHVLVVSGMHLAIALGSLMRLVRRYCHNRYLQTGIGLLGVLFFMTVCGFTMSIIRAGCTFVVLALSPLFRRERDALAALSVTVIAIAIVSPFSVQNLSYQLSVASTFGILVVLPFLEEKLFGRFSQKWRKRLEPVAGPFLGSLAAMILTLPIVAIRIGGISLIAPVTNVLISYAVSVALTSVLVGLAISAIPVVRLLALPFLLVAGLFARYINAVILACGKDKYWIDVPPQWQFLTFLPIFAIFTVIIACNWRDYLLKLKWYQTAKEGKRNAGGVRRSDSRRSARK